MELRRLTAAAGTSLHTVAGGGRGRRRCCSSPVMSAPPSWSSVSIHVGPLRTVPVRPTGAVVRAAGALDVHLVPVPAPRGFPRARPSARCVVAASTGARLGGGGRATPGRVTVISLAAGDLIGPTSAALVFMLAVVGVALIGGLGAAVVWRRSVRPCCSTTSSPRRCTASPWSSPSICSRWCCCCSPRCWWRWSCTTRRGAGQQAVRARAEAALLTDFAITVMTEPDPLRLLLEKVREAFAATSVALLERDRDGWRQVAAAGSTPRRSARTGRGRRRRRRRPAPRAVRPVPDRRRTARPARGRRSGSCSRCGRSGWPPRRSRRNAGPRPPSCAAPCSPRSATTCARP